MQAGQEPLNKYPTHGTESRDGSGTGGTKDSKGKQGGAKKKGAYLPASWYKEQSDPGSLLQSSQPGDFPALASRRWRSTDQVTYTRDTAEGGTQLREAERRERGMVGGGNFQKTQGLSESLHIKQTNT